MAFDKYKDGAWMEPESAVKRYSNGAWTECDSVKKYYNGAWTEVWANMKIMTELSNSITKGTLQIPDDGSEFEFVKIMDYFNGFYGTMEGGGTIVFYLDGLWTNPTIAFDWMGAFNYKTSEYDTTWNRVSSGAISIYSRTTNGNVTTSMAVSTVGSTLADQNSLSDDSGSYSGTLNGTFNRLGLSIDVNSFGGQYYASSMFLYVSNLRFNGGKIGFPPSSAFQLQEWAS